LINKKATFKKCFRCKAPQIMDENEVGNKQTSLN
jgi:hypothetical protein